MMSFCLFEGLIVGLTFRNYNCNCYTIWSVTQNCTCYNVYNLCFKLSKFNTCDSCNLNLIARQESALDKISRSKITYGQFLASFWQGAKVLLVISSKGHDVLNRFWQTVLWHKCMRVY